MSVHYQGNGEVREIKAEMPTTREDGSPYQHNDEDYFLWFITRDASISPDLPVDDPASVPGIATELVGGVFTDSVPVDDVQPGLWRIWYRTVDVVPGAAPDGGDLQLISRPSEVLELDIRAPLAAPLPPVIS